MEKTLKEMLGKRPDELEGETLKLFEAIMKIADERDVLKAKNKELKEDYDKLTKHFIDTHIPKSKVEEYIQELEIEQDKADDEDLIATEMDIRKNQIYVLQRALQD